MGLSSPIKKHELNKEDKEKQYYYVLIAGTPSDLITPWNELDDSYKKFVSESLKFRENMHKIRSLS